MKGWFWVIALTVGVVSCTDSEGDGGMRTDTSVVQNDSLPGREPISGESGDLSTLPELPEGYALRAEASGDLDGDDQSEKVIVAETDRTGELGREREVLVYQWNNGSWGLWKRASGPVLPSRAGGMMGDPFALVEVNRGSIVIDHYGGSSLRWAHSDRFRFQNGDFYLIGATSGFGRPCVEWTTLDYNLSTGRIDYSSGRDTCDDADPDLEIEEDIPPRTTREFVRKQATLPRMDGFVPGESQVELEGEEVGY